MSTNLQIKNLIKYYLIKFAKEKMKDSGKVDLFLSENLYLLAYQNINGHNTRPDSRQLAL